MLQAETATFYGEVAIPYLFIDRGHRETLVNLHGFGDRKESFLLTALHLTERFNLILPDMPGFGSASKDPGFAYTIDSYARWLGDFLASLGPAPMWLCGNSLGGATAAKIAFDRPHLVRACIPICPAGFYHTTTNPFYEQVYQGNNLFLVEDDEDYRAYIARIFYRDMQPIRFVSDALQLQIMNRHEWFSRLCADFVRSVDFVADHPTASRGFLNDALPAHQVPFHVIWGEHDSLFPADTLRQLQQAAPTITTSLIPSCGHCPHLERPKQLATILLNVDVGC